MDRDGGCGLFMREVYANTLLIGTVGQSFLCFIAFIPQIKTWPGALPANPISLLTSEAGSRGPRRGQDTDVAVKSTFQ